MANITMDNPRDIREKRQLLGLTQMEVAQKARISQYKLSLYETGLAELTPKEHARVAKILSTPQKHPRPEANLEKELEAWREAKSVERRSFYRKQTGMSLREFGRTAGIPRNKLGKWEAGKPTLTAEEYARWEKTVLEGQRKQQLADPWWQLENAQQAMSDLKAELSSKVSRLEAATSLDDPIVSEIIQSFRREIAQLETQTTEPATEPTPSLALRIYGKMLVGKPITDEEFAEARAAIANVKRNEAD
jgi:transcriptional regulator with XRE-family HTH domain